ncbi:hypothetical protein SO694_00032180 [Aureococcus anophagefferens]|uniref:Uncharacterized protein n=1 Tax=Aureococcus anophagefferens TaxID=44056 RepID=A0ABR1FKE3_AURAN
MAPCALWTLLAAFVGAATTKAIDGAEKPPRYTPKTPLNKVACELKFARPELKVQLEDCVQAAMVRNAEARENWDDMDRSREDLANNICIGESQRYFGQSANKRMKIEEKAYLEMCVATKMEGADAEATPWSFDVEGIVNKQIRDREAEEAAEKKKADEEKAAADEKKAAEEQAAADYDKKWRKIWAQVGLGILSIPHDHTFKPQAKFLGTLCCGGSVIYFFFSLGKESMEL